jgi:hypothetical protein
MQPGSELFAMNSRSFEPTPGQMRQHVDPNSELWLRNAGFEQAGGALHLQCYAEQKLLPVALALPNQVRLAKLAEDLVKPSPVSRDPGIKQLSRLSLVSGSRPETAASLFRCLTPMLAGVRFHNPLFG